MKLLSRYIFSEFLRLSLTILAGIVVLYLSVTFLKDADEFIKHKAGAFLILRYYLYSIPGMISQALPFAALIGTLLSLGNLSRHQEITAMRAGGVSLLGIVMPVFLGGVILSAAGFFNNEVVMPKYTAKAAAIRNVEVLKKQQKAVFQQRRLWLRGPDNSIVNIELVTPDRQEMIGVNIYKLNPDFSLRERIVAGRLEWDGSAWRLRESKKFIPVKDAVSIKSADGEIFNVVDKPEEMGLIVKSSEEMDFSELWDYVRRLRSSGYKSVRNEVDLQGKLAYPLASLLMAMIATPLSIQRVRSGGTARGIAIAVLIAAIYWALTSSSRAFGLSGTISPFAAAWFANIVFFILASAALLKMHRTM